ncbi:MAG TPA: hypothetical protein VF597_02055 [Candidatus Saccharimonadales bacterium]|jgi:hypothetical protein
MTHNNPESFRQPNVEPFQTPLPPRGRYERSPEPVEAEPRDIKPEGFMRYNKDYMRQQLEAPIEENQIEDGWTAEGEYKTPEDEIMVFLDKINKEGNGIVTTEVARRELIELNKGRMIPESPFAALGEVGLSGSITKP